MLNSWVFSPEFAPLVRSTYDDSVSNTSELQEGYNWQLCYGDGSCVAGDVYTETVSAGGIVVNNQTIGVVTDVNFNFLLVNGSEGILGLSFNQNTIGKI